MKKVYIGTSGFNYKDWKGRFYPEGLPQKKWLSYFAEHFKTVEINATFYGSFTHTTYQNWASQTPDSFIFTIKGPRIITHIKRFNEIDETLDNFATASSGLGNKLSCMLWQLPGSFHHEGQGTFELIERFVTKLPKGIHQVFEFRHRSWFVEEVYSLLRKYHIGFVINDSSRYPWVEKVTSDIVYIRFHGPRELYASKYSDEEMSVWAEKLQKYRATHDVYCYFNNDYYGYAIENARQLQDMIT